MVSENTRQHAAAKSFKSPLFLVIAICFSVMFVLTLVAVIATPAGLALTLGLIFLGVSTLCAWLLFATNVGKGKIKNLRLYIAYSKVMTTISIVLVSIVAAVVVAGCVILTAMGDIMRNELIPMLETEVKPQIEEIASTMEQMEQEMGNLEEMYEDLPAEFKDSLNLQSVEDLEQFLHDYKDLPQQRPGAGLGIAALGIEGLALRRGKIGVEHPGAAQGALPFGCRQLHAAFDTIHV